MKKRSLFMPFIILILAFVFADSPKKNDRLLKNIEALTFAEIGGGGTDPKPE